MKVQSLRVIITKADNCSWSKNWIIFSFFPRTSYLLNFVEYCLSCVSYKADVWRLENIMDGFVDGLLFVTAKNYLYISNLLFNVRKKKGFKVTFVKEHNWAQENLEVLWLSETKQDPKLKVLSMPIVLPHFPAQFSRVLSVLFF